jgi:hypothetical protein
MRSSAMATAARRIAVLRGQRSVAPGFRPRHSTIECLIHAGVSGDYYFAEGSPEWGERTVWRADFAP